MKNIKIEVKIKDNVYNHYEVRKGISLMEVKELFRGNFKSDIVAAIINNEVKELSYILENDCTVEFLDLTDKYGWKIHRRSLSFLFIKACKDILGENADITINHTLNKGLYCDIIGVERITNSMLNQIKAHMSELAELDIPFIKTQVTKEEAIEIFKKNNQLEKVKLFENMDKQYVNIYDCDGYKDYFYSYLVPSTGYLKHFDIITVGYPLNSVVLLGPSRENPSELTKYVPASKLIGVYEERNKWAKIMGVHLLPDLNEVIQKGEYPELIRTMEALHENKIAKIADSIVNSASEKGIILIAGPSSSGKTSFSKRLELQLRVNGLKPITISVDDYFVDRDKTPLDEKGKPDFECIEAIDLETFNRDLVSLLHGEEVQVPTYNFKEGKREYLGKTLQIKGNQPIIIEGIHGLNKRLTYKIPENNKFKIYVSPLTQLNIDNHNRIPTTDLRLIRRIVRDNQFRGMSAARTIAMWESVRSGEKKNIFPYQEDADAMFNSELTYEIPVLKKYIEPLLKEITPEQEEYAEAVRLLKFLQYFKTIDDIIDVPVVSLLKEFLGGSRIVH